MNYPQPVVLTDYVREAFDGVIVDELDPMNYLAGPKETNEQQAEAMRVIEASLAARFGRTLNTSELVKLGYTIASEWQQRRAKAEEASSDRSEGKLWRNADTPFAENY